MRFDGLMTSYGGIDRMVSMCNNPPEDDWWNRQDIFGDYEYDDMLIKCGRDSIHEYKTRAPWSKYRI